MVFRCGQGPEGPRAEEVLMNTITEKGPENVQDSAVPITDTSQLRRVYGEGFGTSGYAIRNAPPIIQDDGFLRQETWLRQVEATKDDAPETGVDELLKQGIEQMRLAVTDFASLESLTNRDLASRAIRLGTMLIALKKLVRQRKIKWSGWAEEKIPFLSDRNRQKYMRLAVRDDAHPFAFLGLDRLDLLITNTESNEGKDHESIANFMQRHDLRHDMMTDFDLDDFKKEVDVAVGLDLLTRKGIREMNREVVKDIIKNKKIKIDNVLASELKTIQKHGGDVNSYLNEFSATRGRTREPVEKIRTMDFKKLSLNLLKKTQEFLDDPDKLEEVDAKLILNLFKRLDVIRRLLPVEDRKEAAA